MILLDTDVIIDVMRQYALAAAWLESLGAGAVGLPGIDAMELLQACRDRQEQQQVEAILRAYVLYWPSRADSTRALDSFAAYHLSHGIGILDALIAATATGLGQELATYNDGHYRVLSDLVTVQPYGRQLKPAPSPSNSRNP
jgi:predicted nucleic acid-binding protein